MSSRGSKVDWERTAERLNDYFRGRIPENIPYDFKKMGNYAVFVEDYSTNKNKYKFSFDRAPVPIRYLRKGDIFIKFPFEAYDLANKLILIATNTPRDPENIMNVDPDDYDNLQVDCEQLDMSYGHLYIPKEFFVFKNYIKEKNDE